MSHTNETVNFHLPQFTADDKPDWLVDVNDAFQAIDTGMEATQSEAESASSVAQLAQTTAENAAETAGQASSDVAGLDADVETLQGTVNTITALIGNGVPTTTDKTIIGAINEINADVHKNTLAIGPATTLTANTHVEVTAPADGYLFASVTTSTAYINICAAADNGSSFDVVVAGTAYNGKSIFMRKGTKVYLYSNEATSAYKFVSITE